MRPGLVISAMCLVLSAGVCIFPLIAPGKADILTGVLIVLVHLVLAATCWILAVEKNLLWLTYSETIVRSDRSDLILMIGYPAAALCAGWLGGLLFEIKVPQLLNPGIVFSLAYCLFYFIGFNVSERRRNIRLTAQGTGGQVFLFLFPLPMFVFILNFLLFNNYFLSAYIILWSYFSGITGALIGRELAKSNISIKRRFLTGFVTLFIIVFLLSVLRFQLEAHVVQESFNRLRDAL